MSTLGIYLYNMGLDPYQKGIITGWTGTKPHTHSSSNDAFTTNVFSNERMWSNQKHTYKLY